MPQGWPGSDQPVLQDTDGHANWLGNVASTFHVEKSTAGATKFTVAVHVGGDGDRDVRPLELAPPPLPLPS